VEYASPIRADHLFVFAVPRVWRTLGKSPANSHARCPCGNAIIIESRLTDVALVRISREAIA
jgi:hypothetical protein